MNGVPGSSTCLVWLREDLRLRDNPALHAAARCGQPIVPVFVEGWDEESQWRPGAASRWWRARSLQRLAAHLAELGLPLVVRAGAAGHVLGELARECDADVVCANRLPTPAGEAAERRVRAALATRGRHLDLCDERYLFDWRRLDRGRERPYRVFTPFWKACLRLGDPPRPVGVPERAATPPKAPHGLDVDSLLRATDHAWARGFSQEWEPGEAGAGARLARFLEVALGGYAAERDRPDLRGTSELSPHLHFGEISARQMWWAAREAADLIAGNEAMERTDGDGAAVPTAKGDAATASAGDPELSGTASLSAGRVAPAAAAGVEAFQRQLVWRDFGAYLLRDEPRLADEPLRAEFAAFPWADDREARLVAWREGATGYPLVDAGMRALWATGWLHNRARLVCASFLVKHLLVPWQDGERWFWDTLVDADHANNAFGWQWVAGSGADAAPYFRVFNPTLQGERHDPQGSYVRRWLPELGRLPAQWIHRPWEAPRDVLSAAGVALGEDYPMPIVAHDEARRRALTAFESIRG